MEERANRKNLLADVRRVVVKVGSNVLTGGGQELDPGAIAALAEDLHGLRERGCEVVLVSSGAIASGLTLLGTHKRPSTLPELQAIAAIGQSRLVSMYDRCFSAHGYHAAQMLLTYADLEDRTRYLNVRNTLRALLNMGGVPIINENDTVSVEEIKLGDNDVLSAFVAHLLPADLLVLLTVVDGLKDAGGEVVRTVECVDDKIMSLVDGTKSKHGTGGMETKLRAARYAAEAGQLCVIANGTQRGILGSILDGQDVGTIFLAAESTIPSRKRWLGFVRRPKGVITVDDGARVALREGGKSLLASGVQEVSGKFRKGDVVSISCSDGEAFAQGKVNYDSKQLVGIKGLRTSEIRKIVGDAFYEEVVHRDNMVIVA